MYTQVMKVEVGGGGGVFHFCISLVLFYFSFYG
jgi:hypothetical protein